MELMHEQINSQDEIFEWTGGRPGQGRSRRKISGRHKLMEIQWRDQISLSASSGFLSRMPKRSFYGIRWPEQVRQSMLLFTINSTPIRISNYRWLNNSICFGVCCHYSQRLWQTSWWWAAKFEWTNEREGATCSQKETSLRPDWNT